MKEEELAKHIISFFEKQGYEVYKEVCAYGGGTARADIYCVRGQETVAIETKMGLGLKVIDQAFTWRMMANYSYIAIPYKHKADVHFAKQVCQDYGIGILYFYPKNEAVVEFLKPAYNTDPSNPKLYEEQKDSVAGNARSEYVTPFKLTCKQLLDYVTVKGGKVGIKEAIRNINHHYANENSAESSLKKMVRLNVIDGLKVVKDGKFYYFVTNGNND